MDLNEWMKLSQISFKVNQLLHYLSIFGMWLFQIVCYIQIIITWFNRKVQYSQSIEWNECDSIYNIHIYIVLE